MVALVWPGLQATVLWQIWQRMTGSWVTVTGKREVREVLIAVYDARSAADRPGIGGDSPGYDACNGTTIKDCLRGFRAVSPVRSVGSVRQRRRTCHGERSEAAYGAGGPAAANSRVSVDRLIATLWPERPPRSAAGNVRTYVSALRHVLRLDSDDHLPRLTFERGGYRLDLAPGELDLLAEEAWIDARLARGHDAEFIVRLRTLVIGYPLRERLRHRI